MRIQPASAPQFVARRMLLPDVAAIAALYSAMGRDACWLTTEDLYLLLQHGEVWGGFLGDTLALCGAACRADLPLAITRDAAKTRLFSPANTYFLPLAVAEDAAEHLPLFLQILTGCCRNSERLSPAKGLYAFVPVKSSSAQCEAFFSADFTLVAIRPLVQLRQHYIFSAQQMKKETKECIMVPMRDTLTLSRLLEHGMCATSVRLQNGEAAAMLC